MSEGPSIEDLRSCFEGVVPAVIATAAADGTPNVTYLSRVRMVDHERIALSNQFFSKTVRNLAENPRASVLLIDPETYDQFRLTVVYERTERRGPVFEQLREDVDAVAALEGMQSVFRLRAADVYRVLDVEHILAAVHRTGEVAPLGEAPFSSPSISPVAGAGAGELAELSGRLDRCGDLGSLVEAAVGGLSDLLGFEHSLLLLLDETGTRLFTIASHGYEAEGVGSELVVGEGIIGMAAARCAPVRVGNLQQMAKYSRSVRRSFEEQGAIGPGPEIAVPGRPDAKSVLAVPAMTRGQLVGVLAVERPTSMAFTPTDEELLRVVASLVAAAIEMERAQERLADGAEPRADANSVAVAVPDAVAAAPAPGSVGQAVAPVTVRFFDVDGSVFVDGDYVIKGVAGRILWSLLSQHEHGRCDFTNREMRLDPALELPEFRDNFESRLILLQRRLQERGLPLGIDKTGRGRFRLRVDALLRLESVGIEGTGR